MDSTDSRTPFDDVRKAFADLQTSEKAAFVFEATFETLGQALAETGRNVATAIDDLDVDSWFRTATQPEADFAAPPPPPPAPPPPAGPPPKPSTPRTPESDDPLAPPPPPDAG